MAHSRFVRRTLLIGAPLLAFATAAAVAVAVFRGPPPLPITIDGRRVLVERETPFGRAVRELRIVARNGRLLDVHGGVIERRHDPGRILLNGLEPPSRSVVLVEGDRIDVLHGTDETEGTVRITHRADSPRPLNPAKTLGRAPIEETIVRGELSGLTLRTRIRRVGAVEQPDAVALTFDDGPWPNDTAKILSILRRHHVPATFFVVGSWVERYPMLVRRARADGMLIANHSWSHPYDPAFASLPDEQVRREIARTNTLLGGLGAQTGLFRPPGGSWDPRVRQIAAEEGTRLVLWDVDPRDWSARTSPKELTRAVLTRVRPGSIVLLHDGGGDAETTIRALPDIIRGIRKMGLRFTTV